MIEVLSSNIANQIAAGEVVQRPASIVKELMENAVDAGAQKVIVRSVDGGRTLLTVIDDGMGMSAQDAPRAFLRHATSKIHTAEDLFSLRTFGFRGEALASIASVAHVEM
ncbi:MAG: DNA mismatch repair endonuclease MutL, partial [Mucinivorans sp.]